MIIEKINNMENVQFLTRNQNEILRVFLSYRELLEVRPDFVMYMDKTTWELFDPNFSVTIFRHEFKHLKSMLDTMRQLRRDLIEVGCIKYREHSGKPPTSIQTWALKRLMKYYNYEQINFFKYGSFKKE